MADIIKEKFLTKAVIHGNIWMYSIKTAIEVVRECERNCIQINGLEAFKISGEGIQPSQEHSIDFKINDNNWENATEFLSKVKNTDYLYEVWYEGY
ncbi:MAG: hypothetical protein PHP22_12395 [Oscillospiraceae bacterium]|jgi:hypothetical protein|nr:hypothetical protein [Oscillospiraceae bacterium]